MQTQMDTMEMFGLTEEQLHILYSLEYLVTREDITHDKKVVSDKDAWLIKWEQALLKTQTGLKPIPCRNTEALVAAIEAEDSRSINKTWFYLVMLEATLFVPYTPLGCDEDKHFKKLHFHDQSDYLRMIASRTQIMPSEYIDRFQKAYTKNLNQLTGKWNKVAIGALSVVALAAIAAATAGVAAGPIAVSLVGSGFTFSGAALTSACLAMVGGVAVAVGGSGITGGIIAIAGGGALLGAATGGTAVGLTALLVKSAPSFTLTQAAKLEVVLKEITLNAQKDIQNAQAVMESLRDQIKALQKELADLKKKQAEDKKNLANLEESLKYLTKAYEDMAKFKSSFEIGMDVDEEDSDNKKS